MDSDRHHGIISIMWNQFFFRWPILISCTLLLGMGLVALSADFIASDRPILAYVDQQWYFFPNLSQNAKYQGLSTRKLQQEAKVGDWIFRPLVAWGPNEQDKSQLPLQCPAQRHWLGTDVSRRDVLSRLIHGTRTVILISIITVILYMLIGISLGLLAAFYGGWLDALISRVAEGVMAIPAFFLLLAIMGVCERSSSAHLVLVLAMVYWTRIFRLVRAEGLRVRQTAYIDAAIVLGYSDWRIMFRHMLPNMLDVIWVWTIFGLASMVTIEAALSFLGFGVPDDVATWGALLRGVMGNFHAWWLVLFPGLAIFISVLALHVLGEAMRDYLDPKIQQAS